jgi:hypothetical protein
VKDLRKQGCGNLAIKIATRNFGVYLRLKKSAVGNALLPAIDGLAQADFPLDAENKTSRTGFVRLARDDQLVRLGAGRIYAL